MIFFRNFGEAQRKAALGVGILFASATFAFADSAPSLAIAGSGQIVKIEVCAENVIHVVAGPLSAPPNVVTPTVTAPCAGATYDSKVDARGLHVTTRALRVDVDARSGLVRFIRVNGDVALEESANRVAPVAGVRREFRLAPGEALYGLGQRQDGRLDLRDMPVRLLQANTNIAIPFLVSTAGYGILWNNASLTDFNPTDEPIALDAKGEGAFTTGAAGDYGFLLSGDGHARLRLEVDGKTLFDIRNMWTPPSAGGAMLLAANTLYKVKAEVGGEAKLSLRRPSQSMVFSSDAGRWVDYYFIDGATPERTIAAYRKLTGAAPLLPRWAYGFWQCRERYSSQQQILDTAAEFRRRKIPVDVFVQDWQYWGKYGWNAMRFDEAFYPDPAQMTAKLREMNLHLAISVWAKFGAETEVGREFRAAHLTLHGAARSGEPGESKESESWVDLFDPAAQKMFWGKINSRLFALGVDGWWLDADEPEGDPLKDDATHLGEGRAVRNAYPLYETTAVYDGQRAANADKRVVILSRSAYAGQQRNGSISWSGDIAGDWETLRRQIPAGLSFSASGMPYWTTDIGGFFRPRDQYASLEYRELLARWFEFGAFSPIFRIHGYQSETEMWKYGEETERILRRYDELRYRLLPYIYSSAWGVTDHGASMMQALPVAYPKDAALRAVGDEFIFGDALLVAPVAEKGARARKAQLPAGEDWIDFWSGAKHAGGQAIVVDAPLDRLPLFVRAGSILPIAAVTQSASEPVDTLELRIYPGRDADFSLYEDGGDGYAYERGARAITRMHWDERSQRLSIASREGEYKGMTVARRFRVVLVRAGDGLGDERVAKGGVDVAYEGKAVQVELGKR